VKKFLVLSIAVFALVACAHADIIIGNPPNEANCIPFSCRNGSGDNGNYEQTYNSSDFHGYINIVGIEFYNTFFNDGSSQGVANLNFSLLLATTAQSVPDGSIPPDAVLFGNFTLNGGLWPFGNTLTFNGPAYNYNPRNGNLELILETSGGSDPNSGVSTFFDVNFTGPFDPVLMSRWCTVCGSNQGFGLVTGFSGSSPEPGTLLLTGSGLFAFVGAIRRKWAK
jgi:hypothetical protein